MKTKTFLIRNKQKQKFHSLACNILPKSVRMDTMDGRDYVVVPMVILTEGVHNGDQGPFFYPADELSKRPVVWNHKPVVVYHPEMNGKGISACDPAVITSRSVGVMMNTRFENGKLKSEAWIDKSKANAVDERIMAAVESNKMMELSTGVFVDADGEAGEWNGEEYVSTVRNFGPDHLALLPDKIGACSLKDGAGFLRNEAKKGGPKMLHAFEKFLKQVGMADNEMSFDNIRQSLASALRKKHNVSDNGPYLYVEDVYADFVIYEYDNKLYRQGYSASDTGVTLSDEEPALVVRVTEYRTAEGTFVGNQNKQEIDMEKKQMIDAIVKNSAWSEKDREMLGKLSDEQLKVIHNGLAEKKEDPPVKNKEGSPQEPAKGKDDVQAAPVLNEPKPKKGQEEPETVDSYISKAPVQLQAVLRNSMDNYNEEKVKIIEILTENENCAFTKQDLENRPLSELRNLVKLTGGGSQHKDQDADYSGLAPVGNRKGGGEGGEEPLEMPVINFDRTGAATTAARN